MNHKEPSRSEPMTEVFSPAGEPEQDPMLEDPRVVEALEQYMADVEAGNKPDRNEFLQRHADRKSVV